MPRGSKGKARKQSKQPKTPAKNKQQLKKKKRSLSPATKAALPAETKPPTEAKPPTETQPLVAEKPPAATPEPAEGQVDAEMNEARARIRANPEYLRILTAQWRRWKKLAKNKDFVWETFKLKFQLLEFLERNPDQIKELFRPVFSVTPSNLDAVNGRISNLPDERLKALLTRYARYVLQYGVFLVLENDYFQAHSLGFWGNKFHVAVRNGQIEPIADAPTWEEEGARPLAKSFRPGDVIVTGTPMSDGFESDELLIPTGLRSLMDNGWAKYVLIEDEDKSSILRQILDFAYSPDQVTVIDYESTKFFVVGENVPLIEVWADLRKVAAEFQRQIGDGDQRGASRKIWRLAARLNLIVRSKKTQTDKEEVLRRMQDREAIEDKKTLKAWTAKRISSNQSYLSQLKAQLKDRSV
jgi:hypothetical protein